MAIEIIRKWLSKDKRYQYGTDKKGVLYCRDMELNINLICIDPVFKKKNKWYYKFINPETKNIKLVERNL